jgi:hypothetical protein
MQNGKSGTSLTPQQQQHLDAAFHAILWKQMATPREVRINLSCAFPYRAGAQFLSAIAYPHPVDGARGERFARALCRREVFTRAADDETVQHIPPVIFEDDYDAFSDSDSVNQGLDNVTKQIVATAFVLVPYLREPMSSTDEHNIKKLSEAGAVAFGWSAGSRANFIDEVWTDTKRVPHATLAWCGFDSTRSAQSLKCLLEQVRDSFSHETIKAEIKDRFCLRIDKFLKDPLSIRSIVELAEQLRAQLATIKRHGKLVFRADELIKFQLYDYR